MAEPVVFLDRDGVINRRSLWIYLDPTRLNLVDGAPEAIARLNEAGFTVFVVTNQPWVGYGLVSPERMHAFHERIRDETEAAGGEIEAFHACTHRHNEDCTCRKPGTGMLEQAAEQVEIDRERSWILGDKPSDVQAGRSFGVHTAWVTGQRFFWETDEPDPPPDLVVEDVGQAVDAILAQHEGPDR